MNTKSQNVLWKICWIQNLILFALLLFPFQIKSEEDRLNSKIVGQVFDSSQNTPLAHVQVYIESLSRGDVTNSEGKFQIDKLPPGRYDLTLKIQGYKTKYKSGIILKGDDILELKIGMTSTVIEFEEVLFTATRHVSKVFEVPQLVSVVDADLIQKRNLPQTPEILREEVGVAVQKTNQGGGSPIIRGLKANKLLFLVDGIRLNNATYRGGNIQYLNTIDAHAIERLEIVHGPISVMYGSDALGGVINVITKKPSLNPEQGYTFNGSISGALSTADHTQTTNLKFMTSHSKWGALLEGSFNSFGDITRGSQGGATLMNRLQNDSRTERILNKTQSPNGYDAYALNAKALFNLTESQQVTLAYQLNRQSSIPRYDVIEVQKDSVRLFDPQERDLAYLNYSSKYGNNFFNTVSATLSFHRQFERRRRIKFGSTIERVDQFRTVTTGLQLQFNKILWETHHFVYGTELYYDQVATKSFSRNSSTQTISPAAPLFPDGSTFINFGLYVQDAFQVTDRWHLTTGARFSAAKLRAPFENDPQNTVNYGILKQSSTAFTGSIGSQFNLSKNVKLVTNLAQGFRTPNLDDVSKLGPGKGSSFFDVPNPDAKPEKSWSIDTGIKFHTNRLRGNLFGFYNYITDLLMRRPTEFNGAPFVLEEGDTLKVFHKENTGRAYTTGIAINAEYKFNSTLKIKGNLSYTYGQNISVSEPLTGVPPLIGLLGLHWTKQKYWFELQTRFAAKQARLSAEDKLDLRIPEGGTPGWYTINIRSGWRVSKALTFKFAIANLLDRNYREHLSGFNAPGRNFIFGAQFTY